jgi:hypothetical protein
MVVLFTLAHGLIFVAIGQIAARLVRLAEKNANYGFGIILFLPFRILLRLDGLRRGDPPGVDLAGSPGGKPARGRGDDPLFPPPPSRLPNAALKGQVSTSHVAT